jgi:hypothetical protein
LLFLFHGRSKEVSKLKLSFSRFRWKFVFSFSSDFLIFLFSMLVFMPLWIYRCYHILLDEWKQHNDLFMQIGAQIWDVPQVIKCTKWLQEHESLTCEAVPLWEKKNSVSSPLAVWLNLSKWRGWGTSWLIDIHTRMNIQDILSLLCLLVGFSSFPRITCKTL